MSPSNDIQLGASGQANLLLQRAVLLPLKPRSQQEADQLPARLNELNTKAAQDNHSVIAPTHVMVKGGEIIGYLSINGIPTVQTWFDSKHKQPLDSLKILEHGETILREQGVRTYAICCASTSPFNPHMERLGYKLLGTTQVWIKEI